MKETTQHDSASSDAESSRAAEFSRLVQSIGGAARGPMMGDVTVTLDGRLLSRSQRPQARS
jgi:hypothetical protein